jgi:hypothetical protein
MNCLKTGNRLSGQTPDDWELKHYKRIKMNKMYQIIEIATGKTLAAFIIEQDANEYIAENKLSSVACVKTITIKK